jgi:hypothetical protein
MKEGTPLLECKVTGDLVTAIDPADLSEKYARKMDCVGKGKSVGEKESR